MQNILSNEELELIYRFLIESDDIKGDLADVVKKLELYLNFTKKQAEFMSVVEEFQKSLKELNKTVDNK